MSPYHRSAGGNAAHLHAVPDLPAEEPRPVVRPVVPLRAEGHGADCRCAHSREAHEHFRRGTDCALCDCVRYASWAVALRA